MEGSTNEIKSWRDFFGLFGVKDFPIMRQKRELIKQNELVCFLIDRTHELIDQSHELINQSSELIDQSRNLT